MGFCIYEMLNMHYIILLVAFRLLQINVIWASNVRIFAIILFLMFCCCSLESSKKAVQSLYYIPIRVFFLFEGSALSSTLWPGCLKVG